MEADLSFSPLYSIGLRLSAVVVLTTNMGTSASRDQVQEDPAESSSCHHFGNAVDDSTGFERSFVGNGEGRAVPTIPERLGHGYAKNTIVGNARAHFGDVYAGPVNYVLASTNTESATHRSRNDLMQALWFEDMSFRQSVINPAYAETSRWVLSTAEFTKWRDSALADRNLLWIKGKPGAGKSTIIRTLVDHLKHDTPDSIVISFFFNARGRPLERSIEGLYRTMLYQLLNGRPELFSTMEIPHVPSKGQTWTIEALRGLMHNAVLNLYEKRVFFVVDALDEGHEREVRSMVDFARALVRCAHVKRTSLKICFASRHYPSISAPGCDELVVEDQTEHARDISTYIHGTLNIDEELKKDQFVDLIEEKARGVFMWVVLVINFLNEKYDHGATREQLHDTLDEIPEDLDDLIRSIFKTGASDERLVPTLLWVLYDAKRLLKVSELYFAIQLSTGSITEKDCSSRQAEFSTMQRYILSASKGLVEIVPGYLTGNIWYKASEMVCDNFDDGEELILVTDNETGSPDDLSFFVQFIHESVRQHLISGGLTDMCPELMPDVEAKSHAMLASWCQSYVRTIFPACVTVPMELITSSVRIDQPHEDHIDEFRNTIAFSFFDFTIRATFRYLQIAYERGALQVSSLQDFPTAQWIDMVNVRSYMSRKYLGHVRYLKPTASLLYIVVLERCNELVVALCESYKTALAQSQPGHLRRVHRDAMLACCELNADCGGQYGTPLGVAAAHGSEEIVKLFLELGVNVNLQDDRTDCALSFAARLEKRVVAKLLLDHGASVNQWTKHSVSPLSAAAKDGSYEMIQLLLDRGASPNSGEAISPLTVAVTANRDLRIIQLLVDRGADAKSHVAQHDNALVWAAFYGQLEICELLLDHGMEVNTTDKSFYMSSAIIGPGNRARHAQVLQLLLERSTYVSAEGLCELLLYSCRRPMCLEVLLRHGADPMCTDAFSRTALYACIEEAQDGDDTEAAIRTLLEYGADPNAVGGLYETPLIAASIYGEEFCVNLLLQSGADLGYRSEDLGTAAEAANRHDRETIASLLLKEASVEELTTATSSKADVRLIKKGNSHEIAATVHNHLMSRRLSIDLRRNLSMRTSTILDSLRLVSASPRWKEQ